MTTEKKAVGVGHDKNAASIKEYWTEERRRAAIPAGSATKKRGDGLKNPRALLPDRPVGQNASHPGTERNLGKLLESGGQSVASPLDYPYRTVGKLFFTQGGNNYAGSASLIGANLLLTAGHCVYNGGWSTNVVFYPSYGQRTATDPYYSFAFSYLACMNQWVSGERSHDYGMVWLPDGPGNSLGWLGTLWDVSLYLGVPNLLTMTWNAVGYPALPSPPFDGKTMDEAVGHYSTGTQDGVIGLSNDNMEQGSSGGPWITSYNENSPTHVNGVQSFHVKDGDTIEYSPYFNDDFAYLMNWITANHH